VVKIEPFSKPIVGAVLLIEAFLAAGCGADAPTVISTEMPSPAAVDPPRVVLPKSDVQLAAEFSVPEPSPSTPVVAAMKLDPPTAIAGESAELAVYVRIARAHYIHASGDSDSAFSPIEMRATLPKGLQTQGEWRFPVAEIDKAGRRVFRNALILRCPVKVSSDAPASTLVVSGQLSFQVCTDELCWPLQSIEVSTPVTIQSSGGSP